ncbi:hypothetical protein HFY02_001777 [Campylobacter jejuni]|nr:hypothetical protein [Campylobacter jejuni]
MEDLVSNFLSEKNIDSEITFEKYIMSKTMLNNEKQYSVKDICCFNANNDNFNSPINPQGQFIATKDA